MFSWFQNLGPAQANDVYSVHSKESHFGSSDIASCFREFERQLYEKSEQTFDQVVALSEFRAPMPANPKKFICVLNNGYNGVELQEIAFRLCVPDYIRKMYQQSYSAALGIVEPYQRISGKLDDV